MDYSEIIGSSFRLAWRCKSLWLLGLFASGLGLASFNAAMFFALWRTPLPFPYLIDSLLGERLDVVIIILALPVLVTLIRVPFEALATPAIVDATSRLSCGGAFAFGTSLAAGRRFFWRMLGCLLMQLFIYWCLLVGTYPFLAVFVLAGVPHRTSGIILALLALLIFIPLETVFRLSWRAMVVRHAPVPESLAEGRILFTRRQGACASVYLTSVSLGIIGGLIAATVLLILALAFLWLMLSVSPRTMTFTLIGLIGAWLFVLPIQGFLGAVVDSMYTLLYFRLLEPLERVGARDDGGHVAGHTAAATDDRAV